MQLRKELRKRDLKVSGVKAELVSRLSGSMVSLPQSGGGQILPCRQTPPDPSLSSALHKHISTYLQASGGRATARNVGRYLSKCQPPAGAYSSTLAAMKERYGGFLRFLKGHGGGIGFDSSRFDE